MKIGALNGRAKLNGLNPEAYLRQVLSRIADHSDGSPRELGLPHNRSHFSF
jgi:transposase IS66-like protein